MYSYSIISISKIYLYSRTDELATLVRMYCEKYRNAFKWLNPSPYFYLYITSSLRVALILVSILLYDVYFHHTKIYILVNVYTTRKSYSSDPSNEARFLLDAEILLWKIMYSNSTIIHFHPIIRLMCQWS